MRPRANTADSSRSLECVDDPNTPGLAAAPIRKMRMSQDDFMSIDRNWISFFIFVGAKVPKGVVLLADITPSLTIKLIAPYFIHRVPYTARVVFCASLSFSAVALIANADTIFIRLVGVMMASLSSGLGELTFLMLSSFYRLQMVSAWSSGTGGAGLLGSLLFLALTSWFGLTVTRTLAVVAIFPVTMLVAYFFILTSPSDISSFRSAGYEPVATFHSHQSGSAGGDSNSPRNRSSSEPGPSLLAEVRQNHSLSQELTRNWQDGYQGPQHSGESVTHLQAPSSQSSSSSNSMTAVSPLVATDQLPSEAGHATLGLPSTTPSWNTSSWDTPSWDIATWEVPQHHTEPTSINTLLAATDPDDPDFVPPFRETEEGVDSRTRRIYRTQPDEALSLREKLLLARSLLIPFMVPLFLVYFAEYTMNQGVLPVILFPIEKTPFHHLRDHYVTYAALYQVGVFISRSSASYIRISRLWVPSFLQLLTLLVATAQALLVSSDTSIDASGVAFQKAPVPLPSIYFVFVLILWEGLLGGTTYVQTYMGISRDYEHDPKGKEFALGVVGVADGLGIMIAGVASLWIEPALCRWQVIERGVDLCLAMAD
ncbi:battenin [Entomortierella parvispora]|uniref:Protein BTN n=1 Tax=Entomortierella parvispora TaxID=205924 RepID=A0A9P3LXJ4_9FUNG|nr:battenin [Entomortierella parvispora]